VSSATATNVANLPEVTVYGKLDQAAARFCRIWGRQCIREQSANRIAVQGDNAPFSQVILRAPALAQIQRRAGICTCSASMPTCNMHHDVLCRRDHGFGLELDPRFVTACGSSPARCRRNTAFARRASWTSRQERCVRERRRSGNVRRQYDTLRRVLNTAVGGKNELLYRWSYDHNGIGIEKSHVERERPIHDNTDQGKSFVYLSYILEDTSRISLT